LALVGVGFLLGKGEDFLVARRQFARRVGIAGAAGEGEGPDRSA
jgi:hypothetical protein